METSQILALLGIAATVAVGAALLATRIWMKTFIERSVGARFDRELSEHKHQLDLAAESARFKYQQQLHGLNLFAGRTQEVYAELNRLLSTAEGHLLYAIGGLRFVPTFEDMNADDLRNMMSGRGFPIGKQDEILDLFRADRSQAVKAWHEYERVREASEARNAYAAANNYLLTNEFFLAPPVREHAIALTRSLGVLRYYAEHPDHHYPAEGQTEALAGVQGGLANLRDAIRRGLTGSEGQSE